MKNHKFPKSTATLTVLAILMAGSALAAIPPKPEPKPEIVYIIKDADTNTAIVAPENAPATKAAADAAVESASLPTPKAATMSAITPASAADMTPQPQSSAVNVSEIQADIAAEKPVGTANSKPVVVADSNKPVVVADNTPPVKSQATPVAKVDKTAAIAADAKPVEKMAAAAPAPDNNDALPLVDTSEDKPLPAYPAGARIAIGKTQEYTVGEEDTFLDISRHFGLGYVELRAANPGVDPWSPPPGSKLLIPTFTLLPRARQQGIVVNLGKMRLYYYRDPGKPPVTYAIGIGREGLNTPTGDTTIVSKVAGPTWAPTPRMREEKPWLPAVVPAGPANPLGTHALYLGWPEFRIHGSNKPWGIGRRVSSGCMRLYPEGIIELFNTTPVGTKVTVVDQPILTGWVDNTLYLEANPTQKQSVEVEVDGIVTLKPLTPAMKQSIIDAAGKYADRIDWDTVEQTVKERKGYPIAIATIDGPKPVHHDKTASAKADAKSGTGKPAVAVKTGGAPQWELQKKEWKLND